MSALAEIWAVFYVHSHVAIWRRSRYTIASAFVGDKPIISPKR